MDKHEPRYTHDCDACVFHEQNGEFDMYYCIRNNTIVARFGDDGPEYSSMPPKMALNLNMQGVETTPALAAIIQLAQTLLPHPDFVLLKG